MNLRHCFKGSQWQDKEAMLRKPIYVIIFRVQEAFARSRNDIFRLFPIISISQKFFSIFFLTLEKIGIDEKVLCYRNISN